MATRARTAKDRRITEPVTVGNTPGSPSGEIAPTPGTSMTLGASLLSEYVAAGSFTWWANYAKSLPHFADDLSADFGYQIYDSMRKDGVVSAALTILKASILEDSVNVAPSMLDETDPSHDQAVAISTFCDHCLSNLDIPITDVLWDMLDALVYGSCVAEQVYALRTVDGAQRLALTALKVKPVSSTAFVVDAFNNVLGLLGVVPGVGVNVLQETFMQDLSKIPNLVPREKFAILTFRPKHGDPRGTSILRPAYQAWWQKMQLWPEYLKYLTQFASPIPVGTTAPNAIPTFDPTSGVMLTPEQAQLAALQGIRNGAAISQPAGSVVTLHYSPGGGEAFINAMDMYDRQMTVSILCQTLATGEGRHNARAAASVHQDVLDTLVKQLKQFVVRMIQRDILTPLVRYNFGDVAAATMIPGVSLGETESADQSKMIEALSKVDGFRVLASQLQGIYELVGLPEADPEEITQVQAAVEADMQATQQLANTPPESTTGEIGMPNAGGSKEAA